MTNSFRPSVNIIRDEVEAFDYLVTPNGARVFRIIADNYLAGNRAFSILGTYGTGKSAFLLALERHLAGEETYFDGDFGAVQSYEFIKVVGDYGSVVQALGEALHLSRISAKSILKRLDELSNKTCRVLLIDEFGKFLEYAAKHEAEEDLYFIQQLAEFAAKAENNTLLIITLHQSFDAYAMSLSQRQRNEWEKVKGRLTEIAFNEPVEQLLYIAAARIPALFPETKALQAPPPGLLQGVIEKGLLSLSLTEEEVNTLSQQILPLELLSASALAQSLQKYGQNERSLFSFLESETQLGLRHFLQQVKKDENTLPVFHLGRVYDFLLFNFYSTLTSYYNPDYYRWNIIKDSLDRLQSHLPEADQPAAAALVKAIGLLNIFTDKGAQLDEEFLAAYGTQVLGIKNPQAVIEALEKKRILRYQRFRKNYILFEGTDLDIDGVLRESEEEIDPVNDVVPHLIRHFDLPPIPAKGYYYQTGTPRYFQFEFSNHPVHFSQERHPELDGYINLIFEGEAPAEEDSDEAVLYGRYPETESVRKVIREIEATRYALKTKVVDDPIAKREVEKLQKDLVERLNLLILNRVTQSPEEIEWYYQGKRVDKIVNAARFNKFLSEVCQQAYSHTPTFPNELVNKTKISAAVSTARKKLFEALVNHWRHKDLKFPGHQFPAEKGIYRSLLAQKVHVELEDGSYGFREQPADESFQALWESGESFLQSAQDSARNLAELVNIWSIKPFRLKEGFIQFWLPVFLFMRRDDFSLFDENGNLVPDLTHDTLELVVRDPKKYALRSIMLSEQRLRIFNHYRSLTQQQPEEELSQSGFLETVKPFISFYKELNEYARHTQALSKDALAFREALIKAKDLEKIFFEMFPAAFGYRLNELEDETALGEFSERLREAMREIREAYRNLLGRIEGEILRLRGLKAGLPFETYQKQISGQFATVKPHLATPPQQVLLARLKAPMDDAETWISSLAQALMRKPLVRFRDRDEPVLYEKLADAFRGLDNIRDFTNFDSIEEGEEVIRLEFTSLSKGREQKTFSNLAKIKRDALQKAQEKVRKQLSGNKEVDIAVLSEMLKELLSDHDPS